MKHYQNTNIALFIQDFLVQNRYLCIVMYTFCTQSFTMVRSKINNLVQGIGLGLLKQRISYRKIVKDLNRYDIVLLLYIVYNMTKARFEKKNIRKPDKSGIFPKCSTTANVDAVRKIRNMNKLVNTERNDIETWSIFRHCKSHYFKIFESKALKKVPCEFA